jgi:hypothetical protein
MDLRRSFERVSALFFDNLVLRPVTLADSLLGDRIWEPLDRVTAAERPYRRFDGF